MDELLHRHGLFLVLFASVVLPLLTRVERVFALHHQPVTKSVEFEYEESGEIERAMYDLQTCICLFQPMTNYRAPSVRAATDSVPVQPYVGRKYL